MIKKNVLITGASRGIGRSTALLFADKGFHVFLNCHKSIEELQKVQQEIEQNHPDCSTIVTGNVGNPEDVRSIFREIYNHCDSLDVLVNNAGVAHIGLLMDLTDEEWRRIIDTNLSSVFYCCREAVPKMVSKKSGRIINISSMNAFRPLTKIPAYSGAKAAVSNFTQWLATHMSKVGIRVNAIAPGFFLTDQNRALLTNPDGSLTDRSKTILAHTPFNRFGEPVDYVTGPVIFGEPGTNRC